jgi:hypothetical protein
MFGLDRRVSQAGSHVIVDLGLSELPGGARVSANAINNICHSSSVGDFKETCHDQ